MGGSNSTADDLPALPQQHIVNVQDGHAAPAPGAAPGGVAVGTAKQAVAVRAALSLPRGAVKLENGLLSVEVLASTAGNVELLAPGREEVITADPQAGSSSAAWPRLSLAAQGALMRCGVAAGAAGTPQVVRFNCRSSPAELQKFRGRSKTGFTWPAIVVLRPGPAPTGGRSGEPGGLAENAPDGTLLAFCSEKHGKLAVERQLIAWGGNGAAFEMKDMFGIQGADGQEAPENQRNCVICLTEPRDTALLPCSHFCVCYDCGLSIRLAVSRAKCPLCREPVQDLVKIDMTEAAKT